MEAPFNLVLAVCLYLQVTSLTSGLKLHLTNLTSQVTPRSTSQLASPNIINTIGQESSLNEKSPSLLKINPTMPSYNTHSRMYTNTEEVSPYKSANGLELPDLASKAKTTLPLTASFPNFLKASNLESSLVEKSIQTLQRAKPAELDTVIAQNAYRDQLSFAKNPQINFISKPERRVDGTGNERVSDAFNGLGGNIIPFGRSSISNLHSIDSFNLSPILNNPISSPNSIKNPEIETTNIMNPYTNPYTQQTTPYKNNVGKKSAVNNVIGQLQDMESLNIDLRNINNVISKTNIPQLRSNQLQMIINEDTERPDDFLITKDSFEPNIVLNPELVNSILKQIRNPITIKNDLKNPLSINEPTFNKNIPASLKPIAPFHDNIKSKDERSQSKDISTTSSDISFLPFYNPLKNPSAATPERNNFVDLSAPKFNKSTMKSSDIERALLNEKSFKAFPSSTNVDDTNSIVSSLYDINPINNNLNSNNKLLSYPYKPNIALSSPQVNSKINNLSISSRNNMNFPSTVNTLSTQNTISGRNSLESDTGSGFPDIIKTNFNNFPISQDFINPLLPSIINNKANLDALNENLNVLDKMPSVTSNFLPFNDIGMNNKINNLNNPIMYFQPGPNATPSLNEVPVVTPKLINNPNVDSNSVLNNLSRISGMTSHILGHHTQVNETLISNFKSSLSTDLNLFKNFKPNQANIISALDTSIDSDRNNNSPLLVNTGADVIPINNINLSANAPFSTNPMKISPSNILDTNNLVSSMTPSTNKRQLTLKDFTFLNSQNNFNIPQLSSSINHIPFNPNLLPTTTINNNIPKEPLNVLSSTITSSTPSVQVESSGLVSFNENMLSTNTAEVYSNSFNSNLNGNTDKKVIETSDTILSDKTFENIIPAAKDIPVVSILPNVNPAPPSSILSYQNISPTNSIIPPSVNALANEITKKLLLSSLKAKETTPKISINENPNLLKLKEKIVPAPSDTFSKPNVVTSPPLVPAVYIPSTFSYTTPRPIESSNPSVASETTMSPLSYLTSLTVNVVPTQDILPEIVTPSYFPMYSQTYLPSLNIPNYSPILPPVIKAPVLRLGNKDSIDIKKIIEILVLNEILNDSDCNDWNTLETILAFMYAT